MQRISVTVHPQALEEAYDVLLPLLPDGVFERDVGGGRRELSWYGAPGRVPGREQLAGRLGPGATGWEVQDAPDDHAGRRARFGVVWNVAGRLVVRSAGDPPGPAGVPEIVVESMHGEFGTGAHPTTRAALELLLDLPATGGLADLGCGSGVLAIAAARLGHAPVIAVDYEPASVEATRANADANGVAVEAYEADLLAVPPPPARTLAANVPLAVHRAVAGGLDARTRTVIVSGLTSEEAAEGAGLYERAGLRIGRRLDEAGWATLLAERPA